MKKKIILIIAVQLILLACLGGWILHLNRQPETPSGTDATQQTPSSSESTEQTQPSTGVIAPTETTEATEPPIIKEATATVSAIGDMLMHKGVIDSGYQSTTGEYDYANIFKYFYDYVTSADYAVANLETTLAGSGYEYKGYPRFNCPDGIVDSMKTAGFDMLLTANNHCYDTNTKGLARTREMILQRQLACLGTKTDAEEPNFIIAEMNGISVGMACYTYETANKYDDRISLNGITLTPADSKLVNSFDYADLPAFYAEMEENLTLMEQQGADATILFIHWGDEYRLKANSKQKDMAQALCDLGVDVIVGGHPHVVEPVELLTSTEDETQKTVCLYSMGNAVSNQRCGNLSAISTAHTEDGVMFSVTFARYSDGTVLVESVDALPLWVNMHSRNGRREYNILPLDTQIEDWKTQFDLTGDTLSRAEASYKRTMNIVGQGLTEANEYYTQHQAEVEAAIGVTN